jgi:tetratricopeptide (TPR) repeat protein
MTDVRDLETERDFLLQAIEDLDREHVSGALDDQEYIDLRDQHVVRAASVLRALRMAKSEPVVVAELRAKKAASWMGARQKRIWALGLAALIAVGVAGIAIVSENRTSGDSITGDVAANSTALLAQAQTQTANNKPADAVKTYDKVLKIDPNNVQALTYRGWLENLAGLPDEGLASIEKAISVNPGYADPHFFKGYILLNQKNDPAGAVTEFTTFLANNPPQEMVTLVQQALQDAQARVAAGQK